MAGLDLCHWIWGILFRLDLERYLVLEEEETLHTLEIDSSGGDTLAPILFYLFTLATLLTGFSSVEGAGDSLLVDPEESGEDFFTIPSQDPEEISNILTLKDVINAIKDETGKIVDKITDLPEKIIGAIFDAILSLINFFVEIIEGISVKIQKIWMDPVGDMEGNQGLVATGQILLFTLYVLFQFAIIRLFVLVMDILPLV